MSTWKYTISVFSLGGMDKELPITGLQNTAPLGFVSTGDAGGTACAFIGSGSVTYGR